MDQLRSALDGEVKIIADIRFEGEHDATEYLGELFFGWWVSARQHTLKVIAVKAVVAASNDAYRKASRI